MTPAVEVADVFRVYATEEGTAAALQGLSLTVHPGEIVAVLGPSGSGKTTLLRILAGLDRPSAGHVSVAGVDLRRLRGRALDRYRSRQLGYAGQRYTQALAPELTVGRLVSLRLALAGEPRATRDRRAAELLEPCRARRSRGLVSARAVRRRATAGCALRRACPPARAPARRRADGRAGCRERRPRLRADRRARAGARNDRAGRQPRPRLRRDRRPDRPDPRRARELRAGPAADRERGDRRRSGRLAQASGGAPAPRRHRLARDRVPRRAGRRDRGHGRAASLRARARLGAHTRRPLPRRPRSSCGESRSACSTAWTRPSTPAA